MCCIFAVLPVKWDGLICFFSEWTLIKRKYQWDIWPRGCMNEMLMLFLEQLDEISTEKHPGVTAGGMFLCSPAAIMWIFCVLQPHHRGLLCPKYLLPLLAKERTVRASGLSGNNLSAAFIQTPIITQMLLPSPLQIGLLYVCDMGWGIVLHSVITSKLHTVGFWKLFLIFFGYICFLGKK